jgi:glycosyltransferase involved in cell wall biosynthesis
MQPVFSIITVCRNPGKSLFLTIESLQRQTYKNFEYIIIDGASTDETTENIHTGYGGLIDKFVSEKDNGIYDAMNKGISHAVGDYVYFLNAADIFSDNEVLSDISKVILENGQPDIVFGDVLLTGNSAGKKLVQCRKDCQVIDLFFKPINHQSLFANRNSFGQRFRTDLKVLSDYDWFLSNLKQTDVRIKYFPRIIAVFDTSGISSINKAVLSKELKSVRSKYFRWGYSEILSFMKDKRLMYVLKIKWVRCFLNKSILKKSIRRSTIANV